MTQDSHQTTDQDSHRLAMYREILRAVPGLDTIYRLAQALVADHPAALPRVLVAGAGGGREIEAFLSSGLAASITAVDPSAENLALARRIAGSSPAIRFVHGDLQELSPGARFDVVTSLLVMHHLPDDGSKLAYLRAIRERMAPDGLVIHADICLDKLGDYQRLVPIYQAYARQMGVAQSATELELRAVPTLPVISAERTCSLFTQAGLTRPRDLFRSLWYRCWISDVTPD